MGHSTNVAVLATIFQSRLLICKIEVHRFGSKTQRQPRPHVCLGVHYFVSLVLHCGCRNTAGPFVSLIYFWSQQLYFAVAVFATGHSRYPTNPGGLLTSTRKSLPLTHHKGVSGRTASVTQVSTRCFFHLFNLSIVFSTTSSCTFSSSSNFSACSCAFRLLWACSSSFCCLATSSWATLS